MPILGVSFEREWDQFLNEHKYLNDIPVKVWYEDGDMTFFRNGNRDYMIESIKLRDE